MPALFCLLPLFIHDRIVNMSNMFEGGNDFTKTFTGLDIMKMINMDDNPLHPSDLGDVFYFENPSLSREENWEISKGLISIGDAFKKVAKKSLNPLFMDADEEDVKTDYVQEKIELEEFLKEHPNFWKRRK